MNQSVNQSINQVAFSQSVKGSKSQPYSCTAVTAVTSTPLHFYCIANKHRDNLPGTMFEIQLGGSITLDLMHLQPSKERSPVKAKDPMSNNP